MSNCDDIELTMVLMIILKELVGIKMITSKYFAQLDSFQIESI